MFNRKSKEQQENDKILRRLHGRDVKYVSKRDPDYGESIIGKDGIINIKDDELIITCDGKIIFRHLLDGLKGFDLMSLNGINLRYKDENKDEMQTVVAYYKYHRK